MKIVVHVERLVLDGIAFGQRDAGVLKAAVASELAHLLRETPPAAFASGNRTAVAAPAIRLAADSSPAHAGRAVARSVRRGLDG